MNRIWRLLALATTTFLLLTPTMAGAQQSLRAAAIVNDEVISLLDLEMRVRLAMLAAGVEPSREASRQFGPQVLRSLIDERLQLQEAERLGIEVSNSEIESAISTLAKQNKRSRAEFLNLLQQRGVMLEALVGQLKATIAWQGVIARQLNPQVTISEEEIEAAVARQRAGQGKTERLVRRDLPGGRRSSAGRGDPGLGPAADRPAEQGGPLPRPGPAVLAERHRAGGRRPRLGRRIPAAGRARRRAVPDETG